jgi:hypothetical protein
VSGKEKQLGGNFWKIFSRGEEIFDFLEDSAPLCFTLGNLNRKFENSSLFKNGSQ